MHANLPMGHGDALGLASGARGVNQISQVIVVHLRRRARRRPVRQRQAIQVDKRRLAQAVEARPQRVLADQYAHGRVFDDPLHAVLRVVNVQRHVGGAGFHDAIERDNDVHRTLQSDANEHLRPDALGHEAVGQAVGPGIQFAVAQLDPVAHHRHCVRALQCVLTDHLCQVGAWCHGWAQHVTLQQQLLFGACQHSEAADVGLGVVEQFQQQGFKAAQDLCGGGLGKAVAQVQELDLQGVAEVDRQVHGKVGHIAAADVAKAQAFLPGFLQAFVHRVVFKHQNAVKQRLATLARPALYVRQGRVLVVAHFQVIGLQRLQPLGDGHVRLRGLDNGQGVDKQPEHVLRAWQAGRTTRDRRAEAHGVLAGIALQQQ